MDEGVTETALERRWVVAPTLLLALLAALLFLGRLDCPLLEPEEARYAEIPRQMLAAGSFAVPVLHGLPYYQKPPLLYWLVMGCYALFGTHDWAARLVPGAAGVLTVLLVFLWGRHVLGGRAALLGALVLCLSPRFVYLDRMLGMDALLCLWVTAALLAAAIAVAGPVLRRPWWLLSASAAGLGLLTKGPVALALVLPPVLLFRLLDRHGCRLSPRAWMAYLALVGGLAAPWYVGMILHDPEAAADFFWLHNVVRYVAPFDHVQPWWYYLPGLLVGLLPWPLLLLLPLARLAQRKHLSTAWPWPRSGAEGRKRRRPALALCLFACLWCLVFFSAAGCKRPAYILPALPPLALLLGGCLAGTLPQNPPRWVRFAAAVGGLTVLALVLVGQWGWLATHHRGYSLRAQVESGRAALAGPETPVVCYPHGWDSVGFYLQRQDVRIYKADQLRDMIGGLLSQPETLVFVKREGFLADLRRCLPAGLALVECGPDGGPAVACRVRPQGGS